MDPITHGIIGLGISGFAGSPVVFSNPISLGCAIGAMAPDIDIIGKIKGDYVYLKHHRGITHSIPVLLGLAGVITWGLSLFFQDFQFIQVFLWTFLGCLSHTLFDILNSYGAKLFMPFSRKKLMVGILMLYDPIITILCFIMIFKKHKSIIFYIAITLCFILYLGIRWGMREYGRKMIKKCYGQGRINILPSLIAFHKWDFILDTDDYYIIGQVNMINQRIRERKRFIKADDKFIEMFDKTRMGKYFKDFTPIYHIMCIENMERVVLKSIDLRFFLRNDFMHHATVIYDREKNSIQSYFHPYRIKRRIPVAEGRRI